MFSRSKEGGTTQGAAEAAPAPARRSQRSAPSIISVDMLVDGNLKAGGDIQVEGKVDGNIECASLIVGEKAEIQGNIIAEEVVIRGRVDGTVRARKVQLAATSHVQGDILHQALAVETGAFFEGNCRHSDDPLSADVPSRTEASVFDKPDTPVSESPGFVTPSDDLPSSDYRAEPAPVPAVEEQAAKSEPAREEAASAQAAKEAPKEKFEESKSGGVFGGKPSGIKPPAGNGRFGAQGGGLRPPFASGSGGLKSPGGQGRTTGRS